jgi:Uma2 family endonuclease
MSPTGHVHGTIESTIGALLHEFVRKRRLGRVMVGETGIYTKRMPDTVRAADVLFISRQRLSQLKSASFLDLAPELVVEVLSPDDSWSGLSAKLDEYFAIGVEAVWVVDPARRRVWVFTSITSLSVLTDADTLVGTGLLAEFQLPVAEIFADLD